MKVLLIVFALFSMNEPSAWHTNFKEAQQEAVSENKLLLLEFSGSDWCLPCIRLHKDVFEQPEFTAYADTHLVLMNADFPRLKKNKIKTELQQQNDSLADIYNPQGIFPFTILLTSRGSMIRHWEGNPGLNSSEFIHEIQSAGTNPTN